MLERILELLEARLPGLPKFVGLELHYNPMAQTLTAVAVWTNPDGSTFKGFDDAHQQPADWDVAFTDTASEVTKTGADTATVDGAAADTVTATYGEFTATFDFVPPVAKITGIEIEAS